MFKIPNLTLYGQNTLVLSENEIIIIIIIQNLKVLYKKVTNKNRKFVQSEQVFYFGVFFLGNQNPCSVEKMSFIVILRHCSAAKMSCHCYPREM